MTNEILKQLAIPELLAIRKEITESYGLAVLDLQTLKMKVLYTVQGRERSCLHIWNGNHSPLHTSAHGKVTLAFLPEKQRNQVLRQISLTRFTDHTITDLPTLKKHLKKIRQQGYATDIGEELPYCNCGGVPILNSNGHTIASLWLSGINARLSSDILYKNIQILQKCAHAIEQRITKFNDNSTEESPYSPCVSQALQIIKINAFKNINFPTLAKKINVSYSTLRFLFHKEVGVPLQQYQISLRIEAALNLLTTTNQSITQIALTVGFCDQKNFSNFFKKKMKISPLQFRKQTQMRYSENPSDKNK